MPRATPQSYYYSGQGRLFVGDRDALTGKASNVFALGNVTEVSIEVSNNKFEHQESMTGLRNTDLMIIKEIKASLKFKAESMSLDNLALGLYGTNAAVTGASVTKETKLFNKVGTVIPLNFPKVTAVVVTAGTDPTGAANSTACVLGTDYTVDADYGTVYPLAGSSVIVAGKYVSVSYTYATHNRMDALTVAVPTEKFVRFEGLNTVNGDGVLIEMPRVKFEPLSSLQLITADLASADFMGNVLQDTLITSGSQLFTERLITGVS